ARDLAAPGCVVHRPAVWTVKHAAYPVSSPEAQINECFGHAQFFIADQVKDGLYVVRKCCNVIKPAHRSRPFDRVQRAKHPADQLRVAGVFLQNEEGRLEFGEQFVGFRPVGFSQRFHYPRTFFTTARSCSGLKGLTIHPVAPAVFPSCFFSGWDSVVSITMGMNLQEGLALNRRMSSMPSTLGMLRSVRII